MCASEVGAGLGVPLTVSSWVTGLMGCSHSHECCEEPVVAVEKNAIVPHGEVYFVREACSGDSAEATGDEVTDWVTSDTSVLRERADVAVLWSTFGGASRRHAVIVI